ncbi:MULTISPECIES: CsbD family protein [Pseudanabaena]|uniref:CsbD family protein n=2 Tax=Pseudanabaena TaxID=1152 RepID=L8MUN1_9CYAN|nr:MULTISPECIES: CsbD family protein [Pseudanabaena]ELS30509.1 CsbD family protein [Pseudanabaena biceps PCC 7429]MDG3497220.1 CsbD family protein [Pseudanabaena catenata USMAC16]
MLLQICRSLLTVGLLSLFSFGLVFMLRVENLYAANPVEIIATQARFYSPSTLIATVERVRATTKDIEGKVQEAIGNVKGDPQDRLIGKAKQAEAKTRNLVEDAKDKVKGMFE